MELGVAPGPSRSRPGCARGPCVRQRPPSTRRAPARRSRPAAPAAPGSPRAVVPPGRRYDAVGAGPATPTPATTDVDQSITDVGLTTCLLIPSSFGLEPEGEADELRQVEHRHPEVAADDLLGARLLQIQVQMAERARRDEAVGVGVDRVAEVAPRLLERRLAVHGDDREAAALVLAGVVDDGAAERLDQQLQVAVARVLARRSRAGRWGGRCSSRRTGRRAGRSGAA